MQIDHLVVASRTLPAGRTHVESRLGLPLSAGGAHPLMGTHNALLGLAGRTYLEVIAPDPGAEAPDRPRWFGLDGFDGPARLVTWVCRVADLDAALRIWPAAGQILPLSRGDLRWRMAVPPSGELAFGGVMPLLIEWCGDAHPCDGLGRSGLGLKRLYLEHPLMDRIKGLFDDLGLVDDRVSLSYGPQARLRAGLQGGGRSVWL